MTRTLLYRGVLSSCNADCGYCPFSKHRSSASELTRDAADLARFVAWIAARQAPHRIFFTPWGEALVRAWYRDAIVQLSSLHHVERVAVQTNLSMGVEWVAAGRPERVGVWATWHPDEVQLSVFARRVLALHHMGAHVSAGIVGLREHLRLMARLRAALPPQIYVWVNRARREQLAPEEIDCIDAIDPLYRRFARTWPTLGRACSTGNTVLSVRGDGSVQRCWFSGAVLGNLYEPGLERVLGPHSCTMTECHCHIGYAHLERSGVGEAFGAGVLERVPVDARAAASPPDPCPG